MTALAPASASISAERSPVNAPDACAWQSCAPVPPALRRAARANSAMRVAGGHTRISTAASSRAPAAILANSAAEAELPFIFQLPATSGRRGVAGISRSAFSRSTVVFDSGHAPYERTYARDTQPVSRRAAGNPGPGCDGLSPLTCVAMGVTPPYDAPSRACPGFSRSRITHAARSSESLIQLARQGGHGRRCRLFDHQLRDLGNRRHFPWLGSLARGQDRTHGNLGRAVSRAVQRPPAAVFAPARPTHQHGAGTATGIGSAGDCPARLGRPAR